MKPYSKELYCLGLLSVFGNLGRHQNVASSCGWWHIRGAGQQIGWPCADSLTLTYVPYVFKRRKISNISWLAVSLQENSGFNSLL
jgi:hypothetical protein